MNAYREAERHVGLGLEELERLKTRPRFVFSVVDIDESIASHTETAIQLLEDIVYRLSFEAARSPLWRLTSMQVFQTLCRARIIELEECLRLFRSFPVQTPGPGAPSFFDTYDKLDVLKVKPSLCDMYEKLSLRIFQRQTPAELAHSRIASVDPLPLVPRMLIRNWLDSLGYKR
jgi:hypothetical protein